MRAWFRRTILRRCVTCGGSGRQMWTPKVHGRCPSCRGTGRRP